MVSKGDHSQTSTEDRIPRVQLDIYLLHSEHLTVLACRASIHHFTRD